MGAIPSSSPIAHLDNYRAVLEYDGLVPTSSRVRWEKGEIIFDVPHPVSVLMKLFERMNLKGALGRIPPVLFFKPQRT